MQDSAYIIRYLHERGLEVAERTPSADRSTTLAISRANDAHTRIQISGDGATFTRWDKAPGPSETDFEVHYSSLDDALLAVWNFYFAVPIMIGSWKISIHRYPYWELPKLQYVVAMAATLTRSQFQEVLAARRARSMSTSNDSRTDRTAIAQRVQFIDCNHIIQLDMHLQLRRDLEEGYVVID